MFVDLRLRHYYQGMLLLSPHYPGLYKHMMISTYNKDKHMSELL